MLFANGSVTSADLKLNFTGSLPDSLEIRYIKNKFPDRFFAEKSKTPNQFGSEEPQSFIKTTAIIDVNFKDELKEMLDTPATIYKQKNKGSTKRELITLDKSFGATKMRQEDIYKKMYSEGFVLDGIKYVRFKRSTSKSRLSQTLFINVIMLDAVLNWSRMDLHFAENEPCDVASLLAYESLTLSGIIGTIHIEPQEILLIDDVKSQFIAKSSVTEYDAALKKLIAKERDEPQDSDIFDGQSLLDFSKFTGEFEGKGCLLLRNKFFKSCAFNANIQKWFSDNNITDIKQLNGITMAKSISDIKMITTPNSLKALKFAYKLNCNAQDEKYKMFHYWLSHIDYNFGVCKFEKPSQFGERNQLSYQMVNSLPLSYDDVLELAQYNIWQIDNINNDFNAFKKFISAGDSIDITRDMLFNLCCVNHDIQHTKLYKELRSETVKTLKGDMLKGKLLVNGDYDVMTSNPLEMLKCACGVQWTDSLHQPYQIYTSLFDDGAELTGFRNPHISAGNVCVFKNKKIEQIDKYLNLTKNIVVINAFGNDVFARLQGADVDSDSVLLVQNDIILKAAKECQKFATPLNRIEGEKQQRKYSSADIAEVDYLIGQNMIGQIVNLSQLFNSYYWDYKSKCATDKQLQTIYDCVSLLSSLSQMEIDKAKKFFTLDTKSELNKIGKTVFEKSKLEELANARKVLLGTKNRLKSKLKNHPEVSVKYMAACAALEDNQSKITAFTDSNKIIKLGTVQLQKVLLNERELVQIQEYCDDLASGTINQNAYDDFVSKLLTYEKPKQIKPSFFKNNSQDSNCCFEKFNTPMDYVVDIVTTKVKKAKADKTPMCLTDLLCKLDTACADRRQIAKIQKIAINVSGKLKACFLESDNSTFNSDGKFDYKTYKKNRKLILTDGITALKKIKISKIETVLLILKRCYSKDKNVKNDMLFQNRAILTSLLYKSHTKLFMECFKRVA